MAMKNGLKNTKTPLARCSYGRRGGNRTPARGFGDPCATIILHALGWLSKRATIPAGAPLPARPTIPLARRDNFRTYFVSLCIVCFLQNLQYFIISNLSRNFLVFLWI